MNHFDPLDSAGAQMTESSGMAVTSKPLRTSSHSVAPVPIATESTDRAFRGTMPTSS